MTPDNYNVTLERITEVVETLRQLQIPPERVHSLDVQHWASGTVVGVHVTGEDAATVELVDRIGDHYGLAADGGETTNYTRGEFLGQTAVLVYCGRPAATS